MNFMKLLFTGVFYFIFILGSLALFAIVVSLSVWLEEKEAGRID